MRRRVTRLAFFLAIFLVLSPSAQGSRCGPEVLKQVELVIPLDRVELFHFEVRRTAVALRGTLTAREIKEHAADRLVWRHLKKPDARTAPQSRDIAIYPACGVDVGLPIHVLPGAGLYVGVDIGGIFSDEVVESWAKDPSFDPSKLFSENKYVKTIPMMATSDGGKGESFVQSYLKNLVVSLPDESVIESVTFIVDRRWLTWKGKPQKVGPHLLVSWQHQGLKQGALLISAPMPTPQEGKGQWWYEALERLQPSYAVMKRPQGFSFDEVYAQICRWVGAKGGMILTESVADNIGLGEKTIACLRGLKKSTHVITNADLKRSGQIFGFSRSAALVEVFPH